MTDASTSGEGLKPVSRLATERAYNRVIGGPATDRSKYLKFQQQTARRQGEFWGAVQLMGDSHERARRLAGADVPIQRHSYIGGALIYLASREEQAKLDRQPLPPLMVGEVGRAALAELTIGETSPEHLAALAAGFSSIMQASDLDRIADSSLQDALMVNEQILRQYQGEFEASPAADDLTARVTGIAKLMVLSAALRVAAFPEQEAAFCDVMTEKWWHRIDPPVTLGQITGAADARAMIAMSQ